MGIHSVKAMQRLAAEKKLGHAATRLGVFMASMVLDTPGNDDNEIQMFWAGRDALALGLGYLVAEYDREDDGNRARHAAYVAVDRALKQLVDAELIKLISAGRGFRQSTYQLLVGPAPSRNQRRPEQLETSRSSWS